MFWPSGAGYRGCRRRRGTTSVSGPRATESGRKYASGCPPRKRPRRPATEPLRPYCRHGGSGRRTAPRNAPCNIPTRHRCRNRTPRASGRRYATPHAPTGPRPDGTASKGSACSGPGRGSTPRSSPRHRTSRRRRAPQAGRCNRHGAGRVPATTRRNRDARTSLPRRGWVSAAR